jgi:hypothetical protein
MTSGLAAMWLAATGLAGTVVDLHAQEEEAELEGLAAYDYSNLRFRGIVAEAFMVYPNGTESTVGFGGRLDFGYLGPNVRVQFRGGYWSSQLKESEVIEFETRIADLVEEQNGFRPTIDLGVIKQSAAIAGGDFHWVFAPTSVVRPYLGIGAELYVLSGSGPAIDDTFVDDSLDLLTVGASAVAGLEAGIGSVFNVFGEGRGSLAAALRSFSIAGGIAIHWN